VHRWCRLVAGRTGLDAAAIEEWAFLERVSTGLFVLPLGLTEVARTFLDSATALAAAGR
jgi:streptomycin 6-kinase